MTPKFPIIALLGPSRQAASGVSTHLNLLFNSPLAQDFTLIQFQVGSEGRQEGSAAKLLRLLLSPFALALFILRKGVSVVHINTSLNSRAFWRDLAYLLVARVLGARVVYQVHGGALPQQFAEGNRLMEYLLSATLSLPSVIVVLAQCEMIAYRDFVPEQVVVAFPNGIDLTPYASLSRPTYTKERALRLLYVGRLVREKGLLDALNGLALARALGVNARMVIAGSGPEEEALKDRVCQLGLGHVVRFVGPVFDTDKLALYGQADVTILPTYAMEGLPYALLECMAAGIPAITTRVGAIPDVMIDDIHGIFVPPRDKQAICQAIYRLADDRPLLAAMSKACQERVAHSYSIERLARDFSRLYRDLCATHMAQSFGKP